MGGSQGPKSDPSVTGLFFTSRPRSQFSALQEAYEFAVVIDYGK